MRHGPGPGESPPENASVILVDENDRDIGAADKLEVHRTGALHRAVSVFAFDECGRMFLQRRAATKYHSGGLWSNSACTHPRPGETSPDAARRCLREELGMECASLDAAFVFTYRATVAADLVEHEVDHVYVASVAGIPAPDSHQVEEWRVVAPDDVAGELSRDPRAFTAWFPLAFARLRAWERSSATS